MDEPLGVADRLALRTHILICRSCRRFRRQLLWIRRAARSRAGEWGESIDRATLSPQARNRIARTLRDAGTDDGTSP
jgi:hypothetical protein